MYTLSHLWWIEQIQRFIQFEVDKTKQICVELYKGTNDPVVNTLRMLKQIKKNPLNDCKE